MTRWRQPTPKRSVYITAAGYARLDDELKQRWVKRRQVVQHLSAAAAEGDRSENAEYIYRKKELRELDRRIRYLQKRLPELKVVQQKPARQDQIFFGAVITLEDEAGQQTCYQIVGPDEIETTAYQLLPQPISIDSPLAKALLKKQVDDEVVIQTDRKINHYTVCSITYSAST